MQIAIIFLPVVPIVLCILLRLLEGSDSTVGQHLRSSRHYAWERAMEDKKRELEELKQAEPEPEEYPT